MIEITRCTEDDLVECAHLLKVVYSEPPYSESWSHDKAFEYLHKFHSMESSGCFVARREKEIIGAIFGYSYPWCSSVNFFIQELFVAHEHRKKGIGKKLVLRAMEEFSEEPTILLIARERSAAASFYKGLGLSKNENYTFFSGKVRT